MHAQLYLIDKIAFSNTLASDLFISDPTSSGLWDMVEQEVRVVCDPFMEQAPPL